MSFSPTTYIWTRRQFPWKVLCNYKIILRGRKPVGRFGEVWNTQAILGGDPISILVFKKGTSFGSSFLEVPRILCSAWLEEFFCSSDTLAQSSFSIEEFVRGWKSYRRSPRAPPVHVFLSTCADVKQTLAVSDPLTGAWRVIFKSEKILKR